MLHDLQVSAGHLAKLCNICGGSLTNTQMPSAILQQLRICFKLGQYHNFHLLSDVTSFLIDDLLLQMGLA